MIAEAKNNTRSPLEYDLGSVVYMHVRKMVMGLVNRSARFGVDPIEAESAANLAVVKAIRKYHPDKGDPVAWIMLHVKYALMDLRKYKYTRAMPLVADPDEFDPPDPFSDEPDGFDVTKALLGLSDDAVVWVSLVLDPPDDVLKVAQELGWSPEKNTRGIEAAKYRQAVHQFLLGGGWSKKRVTKAYLEAQAQLGGKC